MNINFANIKLEYILSNRTLRELHEIYSPRIYLNIKDIKLGKNTPIMDAILVDEVCTIFNKLK